MLMQGSEANHLSEECNSPQITNPWGNKSSFPLLGKFRNLEIIV